jgi:hypothetical protein
MRAAAIFVLLTFGLWFGFSTPANAQECRTDVSRLSVQADGFSSALDMERLDLIRREVRDLGLASAVQGDCTFQLALSLPEKAAAAASAFAAEPQGFRLERLSKKITIHASHSIGALYGFYEVLERLGYRFPRPTEVIKPKTIQWSALPAKLELKPRVPLRGFWVFNSDLDPAFLIWAGRNRFNLVGGDFKDENSIRKNYAILKWGGGHNVVSRLTPTDRPVDGINLVAQHPDWFGNGDATAIPFNSDTYRNPCFGDERYARFFADRLVDSLKTGELKGTDLLNLWPSDLLSMSLPKGCKRAPGSKSDLDDLIYLYNVVTQRIAGEKSWGDSGKRPILAGISYQNDYDFGATALKLPPKSSSSYVHLYYNSLRTHALPFFDAGSALNAQVAKEFESSTRTHAASASGIVEYHSYSIFHGMMAPEIDVLRADLAAFQKNGSLLYAYMHPTRSPTITEMLLNRAFSRLAFEGEDAATIRNDFDQTVLGGLADAREAFDDVAHALQSRSALFGADFSLNLYNFNGYVWIPPNLPLPIARDAALSILEGRQTLLPPLRFSRLKPVQMPAPPLAQVISRLERALAKIQQASAKASDPYLQERFKSMSGEFARILGIHKSLLFSTQALQAGYRGENQGCQEMVKTALAHLPTVLANPWPEYLSAMDMKGSFSRAQTNYLAYLQSKGCDSAVKAE